MQRVKTFLLRGGVLTGALIAAAVGFSAFEAHVVNVTAKIENAMVLPTDPLSFGTVFPQEELDQTLQLDLSQSFIDETDVESINYHIRQKPKCGVTTNDGTALVGPTRTGEVIADPQAPGGWRVDCGAPPRELVVDDPNTLVNEAESWGQLPLLCPYLSKHKAEDERSESGDNELNAFHQIGSVATDTPLTFFWNEVDAQMSKPNDMEDTWIIDLKVPCFDGKCAQDWPAFVEGINPGTNPLKYMADPLDEHKIFGCDLWFEGEAVVRPPKAPIEQPV